MTVEERPESRAAHPSISDADVPVLIAHGEYDAFWSYWVQHREYFFHLCMKWLGGNIADAEDAMSKSALRVIDHLYKNPVKVRSFRAWLIRVLRNSCVDLLRVRQRRVTVQLFDDSLICELSEYDLDRAKLGDALRRAATKLPDHLYEVFVLRFIEELPYREIARLVTISAPNARKRAQQARELLREELAPFR